MKKFIIILLMFLCGITTALPQTKKPDAPKRKGWSDARDVNVVRIPLCFNSFEGGIPVPLYGDVESLIYRKYSIKYNNPSDVEYQLLNGAEYKFNYEGNVMECVHYDSDGYFAYTTKYNYLWNTLTCTNYSPNNQKGMEYRYSYNTSGDIIEHSIFDPDGRLEKQYNRAGKMVRISTPYSNTKIELDYFGNRIIETVEKPSSRISKYSSWSYKNTYDDDGNLIQVHMINTQENRLISITSYSYDAAGNIVEMIEYRGDGSTRNHINCSYDLEGNIIEHREYDDSSYKHVQYNYDYMGNIVRIVVSNSDGLDYSYEFDIVYR